MPYAASHWNVILEIKPRHDHGVMLRDKNYSDLYQDKSSTVDEHQEYPDKVSINGDKDFTLFDKIKL